MRIGFDSTPAAVQGAGVGRYTRELLRALLSLNANDEYRLLVAASSAQAYTLADTLPPGAERQFRRIPIPERFVSAAWHRLRISFPVERFIGPVQVFHGPDFTIPPTKARTVVTIHDLSFRLRPDLGHPALVSYLNQIVPRSIAKADRVIAVSAAVAAEVVEQFPQAWDRVVAIPNGVRLPCATPTRHRSSRPVILIVGTIEPRKNHLGLLRAMEHVREQFPDAMLHVAGRVGWRADGIVEVLRAAEQAGHLMVFEGPTDAQLDELYASADVVVYPSWYEGFGLPVLEAMARGVPVVAGDIPALREAGGDAARYAPPSDSESLAAEIVAVLSDQDMADRLASAGLARARRYEWSGTARATRRVYQQVCEGR